MIPRILKYGLPATGAFMLLFAVFHVARTNSDDSVAPPAIPPLQAPFHHTLAATGIVEARNGNTAVGSPAPGIVTEVLVEPGQKVSVGAPLFRLDDVLQVNVRAGEAVGARPDLPPVVLGQGSPFHLRVSINEEHIAWFRPDAAAW
jgi:multidrug efflux pump subunit AcrA (membrane-fusion protein)